jgi:hypothetical protein
MQTPQKTLSDYNARELFGALMNKIDPERKNVCFFIDRTVSETGKTWNIHNASGTVNIDAKS